MKHIRTRLFGITLSFIMLISLLPVTALAGEAAWDGTTVDTSWYDANTSATEFTISDSADLAGLAKLVNAGNNFSGKTIKLGDDIDLGGKDWTPIGNSTNKFEGVFDGNEKTISNLFINSPTKSDIGLFGFTQRGEVKNFTLKNAKVTGYLDVGVVAGTPYTSKYTNIAVIGLIQVNGFSYVGGAFGKNAYANLTNVDVIGDEGSYVKAESGYYRTYLGGLVGFMGEGNITVSGCDVKVDVTGSTCDVGGILGILHYGNTMTNCTYKGSLALTDPDAEDGAEFGALVGVIYNQQNQTTTITDCSATVTKAISGNQDVTNTITPHGDFYNDVTANNGGTVSVSATINGTLVTVDNYVAKIGDWGYTTLAAAIEAANQTAGGSNVTVTITKSGSYDPFTITRSNVTVQAADGVTATINVSKNKTGNINGENVTLKGLNFISTDGTTIFSGGACDNLTLDNCTFTGNGTGTALYIHKPNITITGCKFENFERGYYTCGDNHAAGAMTFTGNTFTNVRVPIDGYWGKPADTNTNITITGNTIDPGNWGTAYLQLWDYAQYQYWLNGAQSVLNPTGASAIKATIADNTYNGNVVIYATHFNWFSQSNLTMDQAAKDRVKYRVLVELENAASATVTNADGSAITAFNENTSSSDRGGKKVIYAISEGDYIFNIKPSGAAEAVLSQQVAVSKPETLGSTTKVTVPVDAEYVAQVGETKFDTLSEAIEAAKNGGTVELLNNISIDTWNQVWNVKDMTIKGNNHTITIGAVESGVNGNYLFYGSENLNVSDLTINFTTNGSGFSMISGKMENVKMYGGPNSNYAVFVGTSNANNAKVEISSCLFDGFKGAAVYSQPAGTGKSTSDITVNGTTISGCGMTMCSYAQNTIFTNNTVTGGSEISFAAAAEGADRNNTYTITGNIFQDVGKIWFYGADLADVTFTKNQVLGNTTISTENAKTDTNLNVSENYWGGNAPGNKVGGSNITGSNVYYVRPTMQPSDLNTYVPPTTGGGSSSSGDYLVNVNKVTGGKITVTPGRADKGDTVTITAKPNDGYELDTLVVTDKNGNTVKLTDKGNGKYTFTMPGSQVTVNASFAKDSSSPVDSFLDVNTGAWYYDAVKYAVENGLMSGTGTYTFEPNTTLSRGMIAQMLYALEGKPSISSANNFTDVSSSDWYDKAASWAQSKGIITGYEDGRFGPNDPLTREQLALILYNYAKSEGYGTSAKADLSKFTDGTSTSAWAQQAMSWAVGEGLLSGRGVNMLYPTGTATRAEVAQIMMNFCENVAK